MDSSAELLSALSEEERNLVEAITDRGYTLRTAIIALQKTREHSSEQVSVTHTHTHTHTHTCLSWSLHFHSILTHTHTHTHTHW